MFYNWEFEAFFPPTGGSVKFPIESSLHGLQAERRAIIANPLYGRRLRASRENGASDQQGLVFPWPSPNFSLTRLISVPQIGSFPFPFWNELISLSLWNALHCRPQCHHSASPTSSSGLTSNIIFSERLPDLIQLAVCLGMACSFPSSPCSQVVTAAPRVQYLSDHCVPSRAWTSQEQRPHLCPSHCFHGLSTGAKAECQQLDEGMMGHEQCPSKIVLFWTATLLYLFLGKYKSKKNYCSLFHECLCIYHNIGTSPNLMRDEKKPDIISVPKTGPEK